MTNQTQTREVNRVYEYGLIPDVHTEQMAEMIKLFSDVLGKPIDTETVKDLLQYTRDKQYLRQVEEEGDEGMLLEGYTEAVNTAQKRLPELTSFDEVLDEFEGSIKLLSTEIIKDTIYRWYPHSKNEYAPKGVEEIIHLIRWNGMQTQVVHGIAALVELTVLEFGGELESTGVLTRIPNKKELKSYSLNLAVIFMIQLEETMQKEQARRESI